MPHAPDSGSRADNSQLIDLEVLSRMAEAPRSPRSASASSLAIPRFSASDLTRAPVLVTPPPPPPPRRISPLHAPVVEPRGPLYALVGSLTIAVAALASYVIFRPAPIVVVEAESTNPAPSVLAAAAAIDDDEVDDDEVDDAAADEADPDDEDDADADEADPDEHAEADANERPRARSRARTRSRARPEPAARKPAVSGPTLECQLGIGECTASRPSKAEPAPRPPKRDPSRPAKLTTAQIRSGLSTPKRQAKTCGPRYGASGGDEVKVKLSVDGDTGRVTSATPQGAHKSSGLGRCVADALAQATFPEFGDPAMGFQFTVRM